MKQTPFILGLLIILCSGCISEYTSPSTFQESGRLIIEGNIISDTLSEFIVSRSVPTSADTTHNPVNDAILTVLCSDGSRVGTATLNEAGRYSLNTGKLRSDLQYRLQIETGGETYQSSFASPVNTPPIDSVSWQKRGAGQPVSIQVSTHDETNSTEYFLWTFKEDWEFTSQYEVFWDFDGYNYFEVNYAPYYFCWGTDISHNVLVGTTSGLSEPRIVNQEIQSIPTSDRKVSYIYSILVRQTGISDNAHKYYKAKKKLNEELGSIFSPLPSDLKGNIVCLSKPEIPVIGYINVINNIVEKRIFIDGTKIYEVPPYMTCPELVEWDTTLKEMFEAGYYAVKFNGKRPIVMALRSCVDCRYYGTKNRPDFWPNIHK